MKTYFKRIAVFTILISLAIGCTYNTCPTYSKAVKSVDGLKTRI